MHIIPAIDIIDGKCVRLTKGDYATKKIYHEDPLEVAKKFEDAGITRLHLVDLDGAKSQHIVNYKVLHSLASNTRLLIDFGGGIKSDADIQLAFDNGAAQITAGSIAAKSPETVFKWIDIYGAEKIILGADVKNEQVAINGWQENSSINLFDMLESYVQAGIQFVICTDIEKDGMLKGPAFELYKKISTRFPGVKLIASGGVSQMDDVRRLAELDLFGAIIGKAIYEGNIDLIQLVKPL